jgi:AAA+ ATPase superfamily predicted ATPase
MEFLDRVDEKERLRKALDRKGTSLIVLYGRRRIGKSELIKRVLNDDDIYFMADKTDQAQQRHLFAMSLSSKFPNFDRINFATWEDLLSELCYRAQHVQRFTVCLDEFPYLVKSCPELPSVIQKFIDMKRFPFHLILCGSSQHTMQDIVLNSSEPLYGRAQQVIKLKPLHVHFMREAFNESADKLVDEYAVWGGVPRYWELREEEGNMMDTIISEIANTEGMLYDEPDRLLADDLQQTAMASSILSIIGSGANRLSEIATRLDRKSTDLSVPIKKLIDLGYIEREIPFGENAKNTKRSLYKISDEFLNFYHRFIVPERSLIGLDRKDVVRKYIEDNYADYAGKEWKKLCRHAVSGNTLFGITWNVASRWWGTVARDKQIELDVVAESIDRKSILIGECKWTKQENAEKLLENLISRAKEFPYLNKHQVYYALFLRHEPVDGMKDYVVLPEDVIDDLS